MADDPQKTGLDLSIKSNAVRSMNKTAVISVTLMNIIISLAYFIEVIKGGRTPGSYAIVASLCMVPSIMSIITFLRKKDSMFVRYIMGVGFALMYTYVMFTTTTDLAFCYILVAIVSLMVYVDIKYLGTLGIYAVLVNIIRTGIRFSKGELVGVALTDTEIILACIILTVIFIN